MPPTSPTPQNPVAGSASSSPSESPIRSPQSESIVLPKHDRHSTLPQRPQREESPGPLSFSAASLSNIPYRRSNQSLSSVFASTSSLPTSPPSSGTATPTASTAGTRASTFSPGIVNGSRVASPATVAVAGVPNARIDLEPRNLILRSFVPHVGVVASDDVEEMMRAKGLEGGFLDLVRPFGERVQGKITIRDSIGASRSWDDYGVRFTGLKDGLRPPRESLDQTQMYGVRKSMEARGGTGTSTPSERASFSCARTGGDITQVEEAVEKHLDYAELQAGADGPDYLNRKETADEARPTSPFYLLYLRRLLSGMPMSPHESFSHPVACVIAISSRNPKPIEELRRLYQSTYSGDLKLPQWVDSEYLRYYVLIHDEDDGDISRSTALFDNMKRHFGLHCHLLRLRSSQCVSSDDDSVKLPMCEWISATEEVAEIQKREAFEDVDDPAPCVFESDATAVRTFVREMVAQSIVPFMERSSATWNDQVASRRKGFSGRFMSISKRWTGFGSRASSGGSGGSGGGNYDSLQGFYRPDSPEAQIRKLADFAFMLRDFKLAYSTYELARGDFQSDKAWRHYAGANEMAALAALLMGSNASSSTGEGRSASSSSSSKARPENIDQCLETAIYSYVTRCMAPYSALRTTMMATELLRLRGPKSADDAARWARRSIESRLVGPIGLALTTERVGMCYTGRPGNGTMKVGARRRKAGMWAILATEEWIRLGKLARAEQSLADARSIYGQGEGVSTKVDESAPSEDTFERTIPGYVMYLEDLARRVDEMRRARFVDEVTVGSGQGEEDTEQIDEVDEVAGEHLQDNRRRNRRSMVGQTSPFGGIDAVPLAKPRELDESTEGAMGKGFE